MKKVLFIDRDGTILVEPEDEQIDSFEKMEFYPGAITSLYKISNELEFELVMITNQDGLGTDRFPEKDFWPVQNKMITLLKNEEIIFSDIHIDRTFEKDFAPTRKPNTGLLTKYFSDEYDLNNSFVIGDRNTDVKLAENLGCKAIFISQQKNKNAALTTSNWKDIYRYLKKTHRMVAVKRKTKETDVSVELNLDGCGIANINTGIGFFDHMLEQIAKHSRCDLKIETKGDLNIDKHHTIEDTAIVLGNAFLKALGKKKGIERYGFMLPMDESIAKVALDFSGRSFLNWKVKFKRDSIGEFPTEMFYHFFKSFSDEAKCNIYIKAKGKNDHHKIESIFKSFARSIKQAIEQNNSGELPTTKGIL
jgi:imidazoleglycerol-phosphate dehydratase/histidinol-phosphatase